MSLRQTLARVADHALGLYMITCIGSIVRYAHSESLVAAFVAAFAATGAATALVARGGDAVGRCISEARAGPHVPAPCRRPLADPVSQKKWRDQAWQLVVHVAMACWEARLLHAKPHWWAQPATTFDPCPPARAEPELLAFYIVQLAIWVWTGVSCKWVEERRQDYLEMMLHHCLTVSLVLRSLMNGELAIGLVVLAVHDVTDVALDLVKMANYLKLEGAHGNYVTECLFVLNSYVLWPYLRLYRFPVYVIPAAAYDYHRMCAVDGVLSGWSTSVSMLVALGVMHWWWWAIMNRIAWRMLRGTDMHTAGDEVYERAR
jgi:ceramide synthetase